jgi:hypothetical protein
MTCAVFGNGKVKKFCLVPVLQSHHLNKDGARMLGLFEGIYNAVAQAFFLRPVAAPLSIASVFFVALPLSFLAGFLLIGIPGAIGMVVVQKGLNTFGWPTPPSSEATWGIAILISLLMPMALPIAHYALRWGLPRSGSSMFAVWCLWGFLLCFLGAISEAK